jgi:uncharacterized protein (TIGR02118 family)
VSAAYLVLYEGRPTDPDAFLRYYVKEHVPLLWAFPGMRDVRIDVGRDAGDFFMVVRMLFDDLETLRAAITSEERERARTDMNENFPEFVGRVRHQAVEIAEVDERGRMSPHLDP